WSCYPLGDGLWSRGKRVEPRRPVRRGIAPVGLQEHLHGAGAILERITEVAPTAIAGPDNVTQRKVFHMCWPLSDGPSKFIPIDEEPNHQIVHAFRLGKAQRATHQPLDPGPEIDVLALDFLCVLLAYVMLLGSEMPLVGPPAVGVILGDAKGLEQLLQPQEDVVLPPPEHIR